MSLVVYKLYSSSGSLGTVVTWLVRICGRRLVRGVMGGVDRCLIGGVGVVCRMYCYVECWTTVTNGNGNGRLRVARRPSPITVV